MTKKETELFEGLVTLVAASMEMQKETLALLQSMNAPLIRLDPGFDQSDMKPGPITVLPGEVSIPDAVAEKATAVVPEPKKYTIEDCRQVLGVMVEKLGEDRAWAYLKTFKVEMLPDLETSQYAELVQGAEAELAA